MKKIRAGVIGYGNLGKAVEEIIARDSRFELVCIFSRRNVECKYATVDNVKNITRYRGKIDVVFLCGGSSSDLTSQASSCLKYFCTIDAYDTHKKIAKHITDCDKLCKQNKKVAFCSIGWDPGIFSLMRVLFSFLGEDVYTFWGKGISQGHSEALRSIKNVDDAIQYTIPNGKLIKRIKNGEQIENSNNLHNRLCLVVADKEHKNEIKDKIINMPNYFKGYKTKIKFVSDKVLKKHKKLYHAGMVITRGGGFSFKLKTNSNPKTTAKIMVQYSYILFNYYKNKKYGAYSVLDIPFSKLLNNSKKLI